MKIRKTLGTLGRRVRRNKTTIMTLAGLGGMIFAQAKSISEAYELGRSGNDIAPNNLKGFIAPGIVEIASVGLIIGANVLDRKKQASLIAGYLALDQLRKRYRDKNIELNGKEADERIKKSFVADAYRERAAMLNPDSEVKHLFYDEVSDTVFLSDDKTVFGAEYLLNRQLALWGSVDATDWLYFLGIEETGDHGIDISELGWNAGFIEDWSRNPGIEFYHDELVYDSEEANDVWGMDIDPGTTFTYIHMNVYPTLGYLDY